MSFKYTIVAAMIFLAGCANTSAIDPNQTTIEPNSSVVAFSVNTGKLVEFETLIRPARLKMYFAGEEVSISLSNGKTGIQRFLLDVPAQSVSFTQFELVAGSGIYSNHFVTGSIQAMELKQGEVTYLGRIEIEDVEFNENTDGSFGKPYAVKLVFSDSFEDDQFAWEQQYKLFQDRIPNQQVVGMWAGQYYLELGPKNWGKTNPSNIRKQSGFHRDGPPASWQKRAGPN